MKGSVQPAQWFARIRAPSARRPMSEESELRAAVPTARQLRWRALSLGAANTFDYGIQPMAFAALAATLAWAVVGHYFAGSAPQIRILVGGVVLVAAYGAMHGAHRMWRSSR